MTQDLPCSSPVRVALVNGNLYLGGTTTFDLYLISGLQQLGARGMAFSFTHHHEMRTDFEDLAIPVHVEDDRKSIYEDRLVGVYNAVRAFAPQAVFAVVCQESFELLRYLPKGVLRVGMIHDDHPDIYKTVSQYAAVCDHVVTVSANIEQQTRRQLPSLPCTRILPGSLFARATRVREPNPREPLRVLYYGRLDHPHKQVFILPEIWKVLQQRNISVRWTIHGRGPDGDALRRRMAETGRTDEVIFSAPVPFNQLSDMIRQHDIFVVASKHEAGPITLVEAMGHGLVPVCGDIPCLIQEVINPQNGFRVRLDAPEAYAEAIARLDGNRVMLEQMSAAALQTIKADFTAEAMAQRYVDFIRRNAPPFSMWNGPPALKSNQFLVPRFFLGFAKSQGYFGRPADY